MLSFVDEFGKQFNVAFNALKYQLFAYSNSDNQIEGLEHNGIFIRALPYANHMGNLTGPKLRDHAVSYVTACNVILNTFSKLSCTVRYKLFKRYCMPLYGFLHWDLCGHFTEKFYEKWRNCVRHWVKCKCICI